MPKFLEILIRIYTVLFLKLLEAAFYLIYRRSPMIRNLSSSKISYFGKADLVHEMELMA